MPADAPPIALEGPANLSSGSRTRTSLFAGWSVSMAALMSNSVMLNWLRQNPMRSPDLAPPENTARADARIAIAGGSAEERRRALRRARTLATSLLVLML